MMLTLLVCVALHPDSGITSGARFKERTLWFYVRMQKAWCVCFSGDYSVELWFHNILGDDVHKGLREVTPFCR